MAFLLQAGPIFSSERIGWTATFTTSFTIGSNISKSTGLHAYAFLFCLWNPRLVYPIILWNLHTFASNSKGMKNLRGLRMAVVSTCWYFVFNCIHYWLVWNSKLQRECERHITRGLPSTGSPKSDLHGRGWAWWKPGPSTSHCFSKAFKSEVYPKWTSWDITSKPVGLWLHQWWHPKWATLLAPTWLASIEILSLVTPCFWTPRSGVYRSGYLPLDGIISFTGLKQKTGIE